MNESLVIEIDKDLLSQAISLSEKRGCNLSQLIADALKIVFKIEKGEYLCPNSFQKSVCIDNLPMNSTLKEAKINLEIKMIERALKSKAHANRAANILGISNSSISQKIKEHKLEKYRAC